MAIAVRQHPKNNTNMVGTRSIADTYMIVLSNLSNNDKLELITRLSDSMRIGGGKVRKRPDLRSCFKGDWSAVDAESLRNNEYQGRTVESW